MSFSDSRRRTWVLCLSKCTLTIISTYTCTVNFTWPFHLTVFVPAYMRWGRIDLLSSRRQYTLFSLLLFDLPPVSQASYKQVSKQLAKSLSNGENMDKFTALFPSYLSFTFGKNSMHTSPMLIGFLFSYWLSSTNLWCWRPASKTAAGTVDHAQIA